LTARTLGLLSLVNPLPLNRRGLGNLGSPAKSIYIVIWVLYCDSAIVGGNWNNDSNCGPFYVNLNNEASNNNTNIGAALSYPMGNTVLRVKRVIIQTIDPNLLSK